MAFQITNVYSNKPRPGSTFKGGHGQAFLIESPDGRILFDVGGSGKKLLWNLRKLDCSVDSIGAIAFSHGHYDHTDALPQLLQARTNPEPLDIYCHPGLEEPRFMKIAFFKMGLGFPVLPDSLRAKCRFHLTKDPQEIVPNIILSGEIFDRPFQSGVEPRVKHMGESGIEIDPVLDDQSIVLQTKKGLVVITGCAHSGLLNICMHVAQKFQKPIHAIMGGSHMVKFTPEQVKEVGNYLKDHFDSPMLFLNHCTEYLPMKMRKNAYVVPLLKEILGEEKVQRCNVGDQFQFET